MDYNLLQLCKDKIISDYKVAKSLLTLSETQSTTQRRSDLYKDVYDFAKKTLNFNKKQVDYYIKAALVLKSGVCETIPGQFYTIEQLHAIGKFNKKQAEALIREGCITPEMSPFQINKLYKEMEESLSDRPIFRFILRADPHTYIGYWTDGLEIYGRLVEDSVEKLRSVEPKKLSNIGHSQDSLQSRFDYELSKFEVIEQTVI